MNSGPPDGVRVGPATQVLDTDQLIAWRRRALNQQLPASSFPAGSNAPSLVYLWTTMVIAAVAVLGFAIYDRPGVSAAVHQSQRDLMAKVARSVNTALSRSVAEFDGAVDGFRRAPRPPDAAALTRLTGEGRSWSGAALVETATRRPVAAGGLAIPAALLPATLPAEGTSVVTTDDGPALLRIVALSPDRSVVGLLTVSMRSLRLNPDARHGVYLLTPDGRPSLMQGVDAVPPAHLRDVFRDFSRLDSSRTRVIRVEQWRDRELVASAAPVGETGLVVVSVVVADVTAGTSLTHGLLLGLLIVLTGLGAYALMQASLVRPLRALLRQAKSDACGAVTRERRSLRIAEAYRVAHALAVSSDAGLRSKRWRPTAMQGLLAAAAVALLCPVAAVAVALERPLASVPVQLVRDQESRAEAITGTLGNALDSGLQTVTRLVEVNPKTAPDAIGDALTAGLDAEHRLRGIFLVGPGGAVVASAGRSSLRAAEPLPGQGGLLLDHGVRRLPVVYAYRMRPDGFAVVGEFDIDYLLGVMRQADGRARVVDADLRTVLDSEGYRAFQPLAGATVRDAAVEALPGGTAARWANADGSPALVAASGLSTTAAAHLEWVVVVERDVAALQLPEMVERRWALLMAGVVAGVVGVTLAWQFFIFVRPLRRLAAAADRIRAGDFDQPVIPQRHDDVGAIAMCLEICRQVRHTGSAQFGGAIRLRGTAANFTAVLPRPPLQRRPEKSVRV